MQSAKIKIKKVVEDYIRLWPEEFSIFKSMMTDKRGLLQDKDFATVEASSMRALFDMPATMHQMLVNSLTEEEMKWFKAGGTEGHDGGRWFARNFPAFTYANV